MIWNLIFIGSLRPALMEAAQSGYPVSFPALTTGSAGMSVEETCLWKGGFLVPISKASSEGMAGTGES